MEAAGRGVRASPVGARRPRLDATPRRLQVRPVGREKEMTRAHGTGADTSRSGAGGAGSRPTDVRRLIVWSNPDQCRARCVARRSPSAEARRAPARQRRLFLCGCAVRARLAAPPRRRPRPAGVGRWARRRDVSRMVVVNLPCRPTPDTVSGPALQRPVQEQDEQQHYTDGTAPVLVGSNAASACRPLVQGRRRRLPMPPPLVPVGSTPPFRRR